MGSQEERDNFFSLTLLLFRVGNQKFREYFKAQWPIVYQRVRPGTVPPPWQDTPHDATEMKNIQPRRMRFSFRDEETKFDSGNTNDWDFSLLTSVLRFSSLNFVLPSPSPESDALRDLKDIRNTLIGHATDAAIPDAVFKPKWTDACNALKLFNATDADFKSVQDDVKKPLDILYPMLQKCVAQENDIKHSVDTVIKSLQQLQKTMEEQHEAVGRIERKVDQLVLDQGQQGQKSSSAETQTGEDVQTEKPRLTSDSRERDYAEDSEKLKKAVKSNTEYQTKFMAVHDVTSARTDDIFTNLTVYYADKTPVKNEQAKGLGRKERLQEYTKRERQVSKSRNAKIFFLAWKKKIQTCFLPVNQGLVKPSFVKKSCETGL